MLGESYGLFSRIIPACQGNNTNNEHSSEVNAEEPGPVVLKSARWAVCLRTILSGCHFQCFASTHKDSKDPHLQSRWDNYCHCNNRIRLQWWRKCWVESLHVGGLRLIKMLLCLLRLCLYLSIPTRFDSTWKLYSKVLCECWFKFLHHVFYAIDKIWKHCLSPCALIIY